MGTRRLVTSLSLILLISLSSMQKAEAAAASEPASYITNLGNQVLDLFKDRRRADRERERQFRQIADDAFDIPKIARFILGRYCRPVGGRSRSIGPSRRRATRTKSST